MLLDLLLPDPALQVVAVHQDPATLYLEVRACTAQATCPLCGQPSQQVHSQYVRQPQDLPWVGTPLRLLLHVRRFRCRTPDCRRQIFTERLPTLLRPSARATLRLEAAREALVLTSGGEAGARLSARLAWPTSPDQLLRILQHTPVPERPPPRVLRFDEWAWRKRRRYGTILVDLETHQVVDLLADDQRATITAWLQAHPGVEVISRDRSGPFALAATEGAPQARQVADRFHLLQNLAQVLQRVFERHSSQLEPVRTHSGVGSGNPTVVQEPPAPTSAALPAAGVLVPTDRAQRQAQYAEAHRLYHWLAQAGHCCPVGRGAGNGAPLVAQ